MNAQKFKTLGEAKNAGWIVRTRNAGPPDYVHYSATIFRADDPRSLCEYLVSRDATWDRVDAKMAALDWINEYEATNNKQEDSK